jgi:hypothetical protein
MVSARTRPRPAGGSVRRRNLRRQGVPQAYRGPVRFARYTSHERILDHTPDMTACDGDVRFFFMLTTSSGLCFWIIGSERRFGNTPRVLAHNTRLDGFDRLDGIVDDVDIVRVLDQLAIVAERQSARPGRIDVPGQVLERPSGPRGTRFGLFGMFDRVGLIGRVDRVFVCFVRFDARAFRFHRMH